MASNIARLLKNGTSALAPPPSTIEGERPLRKLADEIWSRKNGFYAFEAALLVRPYSSLSSPLGVAEWNNPSAWKDMFEADISSEIFFAEDVFGEQFSLREKGVFRFSPETSETSPFANDLEEWAAMLLDNYALHTGQPLAHQWQMQHGVLREGFRLAPRLPFVAGGEYAVSNLVSMNELELMEYRAQIANQIAELPDGTQIRFEVTE